MRILGVDYGDSRTGVAISDQLEILASPYKVVFEKDYLKVVAALTEIIQKEKVETVVIGYPKNMNNTLGPRAKKSERLASILKRKLKVKTVLWDERQTTVSAHDILSENNVYGQKRKDIVDAVAATLILQGYLDSLK